MRKSNCNFIVFTQKFFRPKKEFGIGAEKNEEENRSEYVEKQVEQCALLRFAA